jgi:hypothetical protein
MAKPMSRNCVTAIVTTALSIAVLGIGPAGGTDQGITGKKLLLKSSKFVLLSKDPGITHAGSNPVGAADSSITFDDGSGPVTVALPANLWTVNTAATLFKYKNPDAPAGPSLAKSAKVKSGLLKAVGKGAPVAVPNGPASIDVVFTLDGGTNKYCMTFTGTGDGTKFLVKDASAGMCPGGAGCGNNIKEGAEQCDGSDATACPGTCQVDCTCPVQACGNNIREGAEVCDGSDATACPGECQADCACPTNCPATGGDDTVCLAFSDAAGACQACVDAINPFSVCYVALGSSCANASFNDSCSAQVNTFGCAAQCCPAPGCGNNIREGTEACDGSSDAACPGQCQLDCTCPPVCGNNVREGTEACDGTDDTACPGFCQADCTCAPVPCGSAAYPSCAGTCPVGQVCAPGKNIVVDPPVNSCGCTNVGDSCGGTVPDCTCPGIVGACPPGSVCTGGSSCYPISLCTAYCGPP